MTYCRFNKHSLKSLRRLTLLALCRFLTPLKKPHKSKCESATAFSNEMYRAGSRLWAHSLQQLTFDQRFLLRTTLIFADSLAVAQFHSLLYSFISETERHLEI